MEKIGRRTAFDQAREKRNARDREIFETRQGGSGSDLDQSVAARVANRGYRGRAFEGQMPERQTACAGIWSAGTGTCPEKISGRKFDGGRSRTGFQSHHREIDRGR